MSKPRVALVAHGIHDRGGMERSFAELVRLTSDQIDYHLVATSIADDLRDGVAHTLVAAPSRPVPLLFGAFYLRAGQILPHLDVDLVHSMGAIHGRRSDLVSVQFCHEAFRAVPDEARGVDGGTMRAVNRRIDQRVSLIAERRSYRDTTRVRRFAAASEGVARELATHYPAIPRIVIPNGSSLPSPDIGEERALLRAELGYSAADVVALFLGGDWKRKGLEVAMDGLVSAVASGADALQLAVVGRGDEAHHVSRSQALGVADRVRFFGPTAAPQTYLAAADLFVFPTAYEAFPLVAIEAAAAGLPLVATRVNGIDELIVDGRSGLLVERDGTAFGHAMALLAADSTTRRKMGEHARSAAARFTWPNAAKLTLDAYRQLLP